MYKKASQLKLRFTTVKGILTTEQLWGLSQTDLSAAIKEAKKILKKYEDNELSFLEEGVQVDPISELRFNILKDVYLTIKAQNEERTNARNIKEHNQKILALIASKKDEELQKMSADELEKLLK